MAGLPDNFSVIVEECIENNMSKDETVRHIWDKYLIPHEYTNIVWNHLERTNPDLFIAYYARIRERNPQPDIWQRILNTLDQIESNTRRHLNTLGQIQSNTDQIVNIMTNGHGFGPHHSAAGSSKRQHGEDAEEICNSEEAAKLQEKEEGDDEESEKLQEKKTGHN